MDIKNLIYTSEINFNTKSTSLKGKKAENLFEDYLKIALKELEALENLKATEKQRISLLSQKVENALSLMEKIEQLDSSSSRTLGEYLLSQALEIEKLAEGISQESLRKFYREYAVVIGVEAQKMLQGLYS
jgi:hypothetical protein